MDKELLKTVKRFFDGEMAVQPFSFASKKQKGTKLKQKVKLVKLNRSYYILVPKPWLKRLGKIFAMELEFKPNPNNPFASEIVAKPVKENVEKG